MFKNSIMKSVQLTEGCCSKYKNRNEISTSNTRKFFVTMKNTNLNFIYAILLNYVKNRQST